MVETDRLKDARAGRAVAAARHEEALVELLKGGIQAKVELDGGDEKLTDIATRANISLSTLSKLNPGKARWVPLGMVSYEAIDGVTGGRFRLAELRKTVDAARE